LILPHYSSKSSFAVSQSASAPRYCNPDAAHPGSFDYGLCVGELLAGYKFAAMSAFHGFREHANFDPDLGDEFLRVLVAMVISQNTFVLAILEPDFHLFSNTAKCDRVRGFPLTLECTFRNDHFASVVGALAVLL
jgi:hypothetical protein